jgi:hypothetical protein
MKPFRHILELLGLAAIGIGCYQIYPPVAWIFGGAITLVLAVGWYLHEKESDTEN